MLARSRKAAEDRGSGFTLIELLIVIVVLGILAAIVVFAVGSATGDSKVSACKADVKNVETALEAAKAKSGSYPTGASSSAIITALTTSANGGPYLKEAPSTSNGYTVVLGGSGTPFTPDGTVTATGLSGCP